jgi:hypothetical protein
MKSDVIEGARLGFEKAGHGCVVALLVMEARYATVNEIAGRLTAHRDATVLLAAISEAVESYDPAAEAVVVLETASKIDVIIVGSGEPQRVSGVEFRPFGVR